ncbi:hypothetical protein LEP1GSC070_0439 [Leptospira santarosai str. AIM]|nr:hypothetical protein LEP1GSC070_0439 [Leptospira santarosai str. AIM]
MQTHVDSIVHKFGDKLNSYFWPCVFIQLDSKQKSLFSDLISPQQASFFS